jgi:hypothetical protein
LLIANSEMGRFSLERPIRMGKRKLSALHADDRPAGRIRKLNGPGSEGGREVAWIFCLTAAKGPYARSANEQTTTPEPQPGNQGEGALAAAKGEKTLAELAQLFDVQPNHITQ